MSEEHPLKDVCRKFLDPIEIKGELVEGLIKDGQMYLNFLDSITKVGYSYSTRGSYSIGPEKLDDLPEGSQVKLHFDPISGLPYTISKCVKMQCKYGTNYYGSKKLDDPEKKRRNYKSKKIGCQSTLSIKMKHMFINKRYRNSMSKTAYKRRQIVQDLHARMNSIDNKPLSTVWYHISLTLTHSHSPEPVGEPDTEDDFEADNSNLVFHEVEIQTTSTVPELKSTLRELLMDTIGLTYNLPEDEESVENVQYLIFRASSLKSTIEAFLNPDEAKRPRFQSFVKRQRIKRTVDTLKKEARIKDDKWNIPSGKKRKVKEYKPQTQQCAEKAAEADGEGSPEDGLSSLEKEMLEASKRAEEALKEDTIGKNKQLTDEEEPLLEENMFTEEESVDHMYTENEEFVEENIYTEDFVEEDNYYNVEEELVEKDIDTGEEEMYTEEDQILEEDVYTEEERLTEVEEEPNERQQQPKEVKVLKVSSVWGGYLNVELVSVNASGLADTRYSNR